MWIRFPSSRVSGMSGTGPVEAQAQRQGRAGQGRAPTGQAGVAGVARTEKRAESVSVVTRRSDHTSAWCSGSSAPLRTATHRHAPLQESACEKGDRCSSDRCVIVHRARVCVCVHKRVTLDVTCRRHPHPHPGPPPHRALATAAPGFAAANRARAVLTGDTRAGRAQPNRTGP